MHLGTTRMRLGERLVAANFVTKSQVDLALREQKRRGGLIGQILVNLGFVAPEVISDMVARDAEARLMDLRRVRIEREVLEIIPRDMARRFRALPVARHESTLTVAMADPLNVVAIDTLQQVTGCSIDVAAATESDILNCLDRHLSGGDGIEESIDRILEQEDADGFPEAELQMLDLVEAAPEDAPVIRLVAQIIARAVKNGASDIHFEPEEKAMRIRTRIDGILYQDVLIPKMMQSAVTARMKILADLDVAENRLPQDGRATVFVGRRQINLRVSSLPTSFGENIVVRILDPTSQVQEMEQLGLSPEEEEALMEQAKKPYGVIVVTGPTGSGKTTTLYTVLNHISTMEVSVFTLEDPVEYRMQLIRQTQIKEEIGLTFSGGLRALLRQDPDVILVGETRDSETAQLMVRAALTGHLVFTTLHTNDAAGAIPRLVDMGVEPYLLPSSLLAVLAQRLVRRVCQQCRIEVPDAARVFEDLNLVPPEILPLRLWKGGGCLECQGSGYKGRAGIFEMMVLDERYHDPIIRRAGAPEYLRLAREAGMKTMFEDGLSKAVQGVTTVEEVLRVIHQKTKS